MLAKNEAVLVDIRFPDEQQAWGTSFALKIPLNELPDRLNELPKDKIIVTACPHIDRSNIAMVYLRTQGYALVILLTVWSVLGNCSGRHGSRVHGKPAEKEMISWQNPH